MSRHPLLRRDLPWQPAEPLVGHLARSLGAGGLVWLDGEPQGRHSYLAVGPVEQRHCRGLPGEAGAEDPFTLLAQLAASGQPWLGWLSYEAGAWVEPGEHWRQPDMALLWAVRPDPLLVFDHREQRLTLQGHDAGRLGLYADLVAAAPLSPCAPPPPPALDRSAWHWHTDRQGFADQVRAVQAWIAAGDLFQANLTACCEQTLPTAATPLELLALYGRLRRRCPAPFGGLAIHAAAGAGPGHPGPGLEAVLSASPERFLQLSPDGRVETRPIKGTRPRHDDPERDAAAAAELVTSPKDRAENVMIVDLLRNDLGRVCRPGSISVPQLVGLESYRQVHHLTSVVEGQLRPGLGVLELLTACWPGGSISGAPKIRACRRLGALEPVPRGPYCGSLFRLDPDGGLDSSILIRSLLVRGPRLRVHAGCGIVADSDPNAEAEEMGWKLDPLLDALA